ncbi:MAG: 6-phosphofructokinase [Dehalococcoidia bacterium]|nr:6-phosphofructokinase [Dehalococcoidia bacterium]
MKIGVMTGGGDVPGLNTAIRAITKRAFSEGYEPVGIKNGWLGMMEDALTIPLTLEAISGILPRGGTILGTSRNDPFDYEDGPQKVLDNIKRLGLDSLVVIGGDGTLMTALRISKLGIKTVGIPKTIDNDIAGTDYCIGFDTATNIVMNALDNLRTTAESHHRVIIVEVMGRDAGWLATLGGLAGGADVIIVPEVEMGVEDIAEALRERHRRGKTFSIVAIAEGAKPKGLKTMPETVVDKMGYIKLGGIAHALAPELEALTGYETRVTILGHLQRGGSPSAFDRVVATCMGNMAVELIKNGTFGMLVAYRNGNVVPVSLDEALNGKPHKLDLDLYRMTRYFS